MATIHSLPPEILLRIFRLANRSPLAASGPLTYVDTDFGDHCTTLCAAAVVCQLWRTLAQQALWEEVLLGSQEQVESFVEATGRTGLSTFHLRVQLKDVEGGAGLAAAAIRASVGLRTLRIESVSAMDMGALGGAELAGLTQLELISTTFLPQTTLHSLPFVLSHLYLTIGGNTFGAPGSLAPFHTFLQPSLTHLGLNAESTPHQINDYHRHLLPRLSLLAPHLLSLTFYSQDLLGEVLFPFLKLCTHLEHFRSLDNAFLALLPSALKSWTYDTRSQKIMQRMPVLWDEECVALSRIETFLLPACTLEGLKMEMDWDLLEGAAEEHGVRIVLTEDWGAQGRL